MSQISQDLISDLIAKLLKIRKELNVIIKLK